MKLESDSFPPEDSAWKPFFSKQSFAVYLTLSQNTTALNFMEIFTLTGITS